MSEQATAIILDTETTSVENPEIIELAWGNYSLKKPLVDVQSQLYCPRGPIAFGAMATHHILPEDLAGLPEWTGYVPIATYHIGHNVDFDWGALGKPVVKRICTLAMARAVWPELDSHSLSALVYFLEGPTHATREKLRNAHSAVADIHFCATVLNAILTRVPEIRSIADLYDFSEACRVPSIMPFGKHKGQPVSKVDAGYRAWYRKQSDPDPYILAAFDKYPCR